MRADDHCDQPEENRLSPAADMADLSLAERRSIERRSRPSAALIHETIRSEGEAELRRSTVALLSSGFAAGLSIAISLIGEALLKSRLPDTGWADLVSKFGYSMGFLVVVLGRQQLFTENTLTPVLSLLHARSSHNLRRLLRLWGLVLCANVAGAGSVALALSHSEVLAPAVAAAAIEVAEHAMAHSPGAMFVKGILAGWIIALMVWLLPAAEGSRVSLIALLTYLVALGGFSHVIAGSVDSLYLVAHGRFALSDFAFGFFLPTLAGNSIGGVALVAALNYGQVAAEIEEQQPDGNSRHPDSVR